MRMTRTLLVAGWLVLVIMTAGPPAARASDCSRTSWPGLTALADLGAGTYQGQKGGLYPEGSNQPPAAYLDQGLSRAAQVVPRDTNGRRDDAGGRIVLLSIGMSNTVAETAAFQQLAASDPARNPQVVIVNGAEGGKDAEQVRDPGNDYWTSWVPGRLAQAGVSANQVQAVWLKEAIARPAQFGGFPDSAQRLRSDLGSIVHILVTTFPKLQLVHVSSRIYGGYASTDLNPEPFAYESGFSVRWLIGNRIRNNPSARPWVGWGPYLWANGLQARSDGLTWACADLQADGTHPSPSGQRKVADMLLSFYKNDPTTSSWFVS